MLTSNEHPECYIITGANRGIGFGLTQRLLEAGVSVLAVSRTEEGCRRVSELLCKHSQRFSTYSLDIRDAKKIAQFGEYLQANGIRVRVLINNAGVCLDGEGSFNLEDARFEQLSHEILEQTFRTNLFGPFHMVQAVVKSMLKSSLILNVSSSLGDLNTLDSGWLAYRTSKAALNAVTSILAKELADREISVNSVAPGWVRTEMGGEEAPVEITEAVKWIVSIIQKALKVPSSNSGSFFSFD